MAMRKMKMKSAMKAMKKMKAMKAMKAMRRRAMKKSTVGKKFSVYSNKYAKTKTAGGLTKADLIKNKRGKVVSKKSAAAKKGKGFKKLAKWGVAFKAARKALGIKGFCPCGGKTAKGQALLKKTRSLYKK